MRRIVRVAGSGWWWGSGPAEQMPLTAGRPAAFWAEAVHTLRQSSAEGGVG